MGGKVPSTIDLPKAIREIKSGLFRIKLYVGKNPRSGTSLYLVRMVEGTPIEALRLHDQLVDELASRGDGAIEGDPLLSAVFDRVIAHLHALRRSALTTDGYRAHMDALLDGVWEFAHDEHGKLVPVPDFEGCDCTSTNNNCLCGFKRVLVAPGVGRKVRLSKLTRSRLQAFYDGLSAAGRDPHTIARYHSTFRRSLNLAVKWELTTTNVAMGTERPSRIKKHPKRQSDTAVAELVAAAFADDWDLGMAVQLSCAAGSRRGEVIASRWNWLDGANFEISDAARRPKDRDDTTHNGVTVNNGTKTHADREVTLDSFTLELLAEHRQRMEQRAESAGMELASDAFIFSDAPDGSEPWLPDRISNAVYRLRKNTSFTGSLKDLRAWSHTIALESGAQLADVVRRGGWGDASTFLTYYLRSAGDADAAMADAIGERLRPAHAPKVPKAEEHDELAARRLRKRAV